MYLVPIGSNRSHRSGQNRKKKAISIHLSLLFFLPPCNSACDFFWSANPRAKPIYKDISSAYFTPTSHIHLSQQSISTPSISHQQKKHKTPNHQKLKTSQTWANGTTTTMEARPPPGSQKFPVLNRLRKDGDFGVFADFWRR